MRQVISMPAKRVSIVSCKLVKEASLLYAQRKISQPEDADSLVRGFLEDADREKMILVCLDRKGQPTVIQIISIGTLHSSLVHPREVFKTAILANSASIILAHNHPSSDPTPSCEDIEVTKRIKEAGEIIGIELLDHLIIGTDGNFISLKKIGQM